MKNLLFALSLSILMLLSLGGNSQNSHWSVGADLFNRYVWRGTDFGNAPVVQPTIEFSAGGFALGAWGSYSLSANTGGTEADLYMGYSFNFGFEVIVTDYYFPVEPGTSGDYFDSDFHTFEIGASQSIGDFYLSGFYFMNANDDMYLEAGYTIGSVDLFVGGGDNSYTDDGDFDFCNVGIATSKEIKLTDSFSLPLSGSVILNPSREQIFLVVGLSL